MTRLPPGFRFHPTDVELIKYYLKRKLLGKRIAFDAIAAVDIYKYAPWDLPGKSRLDGGDRKWYFFCSVKKYGCGAKSNRSTSLGYWKSTGKDRPVGCGDSVVGMVKTLVFHLGKCPKGERTDWVMYEYRIEGKELGNDCGAARDGYVLCAVFKKDGPGPRVGAQYGALFREEDWDNDENEDEENCTKFRGEAAPLMVAVSSFEPHPAVPDAHAAWHPRMPSGYDVPLLDLPQIARENDDILSMLAMFGEEDTSHVSGQGKDRIDCGNTCTNSASNSVDIYFGLEDLENIGPLADSIYSSCGPCSAKDSMDQLHSYGEAQFLEMMDFDVPLSYSKDAVQDETLEADTFVDYHNYGNQPYHFPGGDANFAASFNGSATACDQQNGDDRTVDLLRGIPSFDNVDSATQKLQVESEDAQKSFSRGDHQHSIYGVLFCHCDGSSTHVKAEVTRTGSTKDALSNKLGESSFTVLEVEFEGRTTSSNIGVTLMFFPFCIIALINRHFGSMSNCVTLQQSLLFIWFICRGSYTSIFHVVSSTFHHLDECASFGLTMCFLLFNCCFLSFHYSLSLGSKAKVRNACVC